MGDGKATKALVVGGGLVGSLLATFLVRRGLRVEVYEKRPDPRRHGADGGRSINLVLTRRGIRALEQVGLAEGALRLTVPVTGRMMHSPTGELAYQPYGRDESECNYSISRGGLNVYLIDAAEKAGATFRFDAAFIDADFDAGRATFEQPDGRRFDVEAPLLFGADGGGSAVRTALQKLPGFEESLDILTHGYKELLIPAGPGGTYNLERNALHIWPRGEFMLMALANLDGSFTSTLYLPNTGTHGFDTIQDAAAVDALFEEHFADAVPLIPDLAHDYFANPTGFLGTVRCRPWRWRDRVALIGDAAHAIVPFFGQGMNCGFEDCTELGRLLDRPGARDWGALFEEYEALRKPNGDAIADMALENFVEMREKVADEAFLLRKTVEHRLELEMPEEYRSRYSMVMYSHIPFRTAQEIGAVQRGILDDLCRELSSPDELDLDRARSLIRERLTPLLKQHGARLDY